MVQHRPYEAANICLGSCELSCSIEARLVSQSAKVENGSVKIRHLYKGASGWGVKSSSEGGSIRNQPTSASAAA